MEKRRSINLEILRILCIYMVLYLHSYTHSGVLEKVLPFSGNFYGVWIILSLFYCTINGFVMISGYFMINSTFNIKKILNLWFQVWFYSVVIFIIFYIFKPFDLTRTDLINSILPISRNSYWFATSYILLYLFFPLLNKIVKKLDRVKLKRLIIVMIVFFGVLPEIMPATYGILLGSGKGILWFATAYFMGAYCRLYVDYKTINRKLCVVGYFVPAIFALLVRISLIIVFKLDPYDTQQIWRIYGNNTIFITISSIYLFLFFMSYKDLRLKPKYEKVIIKISSCTFAVYLIHDNYLVRTWLWALLKTYTWVKYPYFLLFLLVVNIVIFSICLMIEILRRNIGKQIKKIGRVTNQ
ncbi:acyltransferase [Intestinibacter sp.]